MQYRRLGTTGIMVSEIGFGAWGIGGATPGATSYGRTDDAVSLRALEQAIDEGITFFDTSAVYGYGHSEELIGRAFAGRRDRVVIATKAGLAAYGEPPDFSPGALATSLDGSLRRLRTDHVDLFQLHNPSPELLRDLDQVVGAVSEFRRAGKIRAFGISVRQPADGSLAIRAASPDALQLNFNVLDQRLLDIGLEAEAARTRTSLVVRTPLCFGFLSGAVDETTVFAASDHRSRWTRGQIGAWSEGARAVRAVMNGPERQTPSQFALRYCLSFGAVASVIPGILTDAEARENGAASDLGPLAAGDLAALRAIYRASTEFVGAVTADPGKK
jgi:aryl-alcohol dehydrogenase-like predicted oxidoreductase